MANKRNITAKMFLNYAHRSSKTVDGFLAAYRDWIATGELADKTSPILSQIDSKSVTPENGLTAIKNIAIMHVLAQESEKAEKAMLAGPKEPRSEKPITAVVFKADGTVAQALSSSGELKDLRANFDHPQDADRWCWNRLDAGESDWYAKVTWHKVFLKGVPMETTITREDALRALKKANKTPFMHRNRTSGALKPKMKVRGDKQAFSHG